MTDEAEAIRAQLERGGAATIGTEPAGPPKAARSGRSNRIPVDKLAPSDDWRLAVLDAMVMWEMWPQPGETPRQSLHRLLVVENQVALDPQVSRSAAALIAEGQRRAHAELAELAATEWIDKPQPEDRDIEAAHPLKSGRHDLYLEAMRLVGARHSKGALVDLVVWLLLRAEKG